MAKADITINGKRYVVSCEEGQEHRLHHLGEKLDRRVTEMSNAMGDIGSERLFLATAISLLDELEDVESRVGMDKLDTRIANIESRAVQALVDAAGRIERINAKIEKAG